MPGRDDAAAQSIGIASLVNPIEEFLDDPRLLDLLMTVQVLEDGIGLATLEEALDDPLEITYPPRYPTRPTTPPSNRNRSNKTTVTRTRNAPESRRAVHRNERDYGPTVPPDYRISRTANNRVTSAARRHRQRDQPLHDTPSVPTTSPLPHKHGLVLGAMPVLSRPDRINKTPRALTGPDSWAEPLRRTPDHACLARINSTPTRSCHSNRRTAPPSMRKPATDHPLP